MYKYKPQEFVDALTNKMGRKNIRSCPFCNSDKFTTTEQVASILIGEDIGSLNLGPTIPSGMIICQNCGHIEFFALGSLGMLHKEESNDAK